MGIIKKNSIIIMGNFFGSDIVSLPPMGADPDTIVLTGYSCGSWMAHQTHVINSGTIKGVGLFNGGIAFGGY